MGLELGPPLDIAYQKAYVWMFYLPQNTPPAEKQYVFRVSADPIEPKLCHPEVYASTTSR